MRRKKIASADDEDSCRLARVKQTFSKKSLVEFKNVIQLKGVKFSLKFKQVEGGER